VIKHFVLDVCEESLKREIECEENNNENFFPFFLEMNIMFPLMMKITLNI